MTPPAPDHAGAGPDDTPPPPSIRDRARAALDRQLETLERIAEDDAADYPHRLRAVEMIAALAGEESRPHGPPGGPGGPHAAAKHAPAKHAPAKHAAGKHAAAKHPAAKHAAAKRPGGSNGGEENESGA